MNAPLKNFNFRSFILSDIFGFSGWALSDVLMSWYIFNETNSTTYVGVVLFIPSLFLLFLGPLGGKFADKYSRKLLLIIGKVVNLILFLLIAILINLDFNGLIFVVMCFSIVGAQEALTASSVRNLLADIVGLKNLTTGTSILEAGNSFIYFISPLIVSFLILIFQFKSLFWGIPMVYTLSTIFALLLFINFKKLEIRPQSDSSVFDGLKYSWNEKNLRILLFLTTTLFFWGITHPLIPKIARDVLEIGGSGFALLVASEGLGWFIGSVMIYFLPSFFKNSKSLVLCTLGYSIFMIFFSLSTVPILSMFFLLISGIFHVIWWTMIIVFLQTLSAEKYKGRVMGLFFTLITFDGFGFLIGGWSGENIGIKITIIIASVATFLIHILVYTSSYNFRKLNSKV